jgi:membrane protease YdiL (CAAX protease family)
MATLKRFTASILKMVRDSSALARWILLLALVLSVLVWLALRAVLEPVESRPEYKIGLLAGLAVLFFILGLAGVRWSLPRAARGSVSPPAQESLPGTVRAAALFPTLSFFAAASLPPVLAIVLPGWIVAKFPLANMSFDRLGAWLGASLPAGQPWFPFWQGLVLSIWALSAFRKKEHEQVSPARISQGILGLVVGFALWLVSIFLFSLLSRSLVLALPAFSFIGQAGAVLAGLVLAPIGEEYAFRHVLRRGGPSPLLVSALFATLQFRPLLWIPAFLLGLGLDALVRRTGRLAPAIAAHALFNLLMLALNATWIL